MSKGEGWALKALSFKGSAEDKGKDFAFKGPLFKGAVSRKADWGIRVVTTLNLNRS